MKCNVCGKEFGNGAYCQNCGSDIITARGNYTGGYQVPDIPGDSNKNTNASNGGQTSSEGNQADQFMVCYSCANVIPSDSEYCPHCRKKLFEVCPKCGHKYSSQYKICNKCGTDREEYLEEQRKLEQQRQELLQKQKEERRRREQQEAKQRKQDEEKRRREQQEARRQKEGEFISFVVGLVFFVLFFAILYFIIMIAIR